MTTKAQNTQKHEIQQNGIGKNPRIGLLLFFVVFAIPKFPTKETKTPADIQWH